MIQKLVPLICTILQGFVYIKVYEKIAYKKFNKNRIIYLFIISVIMVINNLYSALPYKLIFSILLTFALLKVIFKDSTKTTIFYVVIITIVSIILEILFSILLPAIIKNPQDLNNNQIIKFTYSIINCLAIYHILSTKLVRRAIDYLYKTYVNILNFYTLTGFGILILCLGFYFYNKNLHNVYIYFLVISLFIMFGILIYNTVKKSYSNKILTIKNEHLEESNVIYKQISEDYSELKHNLTNDLISVKSLLPKKDQAIINTIIKKYEKNFHWLTNINDVPSGIQGLFYIKLTSIKNKNIKFRVNYKLDFDIKDVVKPKDYHHICEILGIWIDNAIEAVENCDEKIILAEIDGNKDNFIIKITNTFKGNMDLDKLGTKKYSTKNRNSGYGLNYVQKVSGKRIKIDYNIINNLFISNLIYLNKPNKK